MPILEWRPQTAGGVNTDDSIDLIPSQQLQVCDNYVPYRGRLRLMEGNSAFVATAVAPRTRHLCEFLQDDAVGGTTKKMLRMQSDGTIEAIHTGTAVALTGPVIASSTVVLWDTCHWEGVLYLANGNEGLMQTSDGLAYATTAGSPPSNPRYVEAFKNRLFIAGRFVAPQSVHYSAESDETTWTGNDSGTEIISSPHGDFVTCIRSVDNYLAIFTPLTITVLLGDHPDDWTKRTVYEDHGASSHRTVHRVGGGLVYANDFGVWFLSADLKRIELSKDIRRYWQNLTSSSTRRNKARSSFMHAAYDPNPDTHRYYIWVAEGSSTKEDVCWIFHFNSGEWSRMVLFMNSGETCQASCTRENSSGQRFVYFSAGADDTTTVDKQVWVIDGSAGFASRTGDTDIETTFTTGIVSGSYNPQAPTMGPVATKKWLNFFALIGATTTSNTNLTFAWTGHGVLDAASQATIMQSITSASSAIIRPRVPMSVNGWGVVLTLTYKGTVDHSFNGGFFEYEESGRM